MSKGAFRRVGGKMFLSSSHVTRLARSCEHADRDMGEFGLQFTGRSSTFASETTQGVSILGASESVALEGRRLEDLSAAELASLRNLLVHGQTEPLGGEGVVVHTTNSDRFLVKHLETGADDVAPGTSSAMSSLVLQVWLDAQRPLQPATPALAERALCLLYPADRLDEVLGDMEEMFGKLSARHGAVYARFWYVWQVLGHAIGRLTAAAAKASELVGLKRT